MPTVCRHAYYYVYRKLYLCPQFVDMHTTMSTVQRIYAHRVYRHAYYYVYCKLYLCPQSL